MHLQFYRGGMSYSTGGVVNSQHAHCGGIRGHPPPCEICSQNLHTFTCEKSIISQLMRQALRCGPKTYYLVRKMKEIGPERGRASPVSPLRIRQLQPFTCESVAWKFKRDHHCRFRSDRTPNKRVDKIKSSVNLGQNIY